MPAPLVPWSPSNIPSEIQAELNRRKTNRSFTFKQNESSNWDANGGDWNAYKGPMVSWVRMCSNSAGNPAVKKPRFILNSGDGFYKTYGFNKPTPTSPNNQVIGYTPGENDLSDFGVPHTIDNTLITPVGGNFPINVPTPEISKIDVTVQKELFRRATVEWVCFSWKQLEYMTPYFLIPGITVMLEFGWNHFNPTSLVPLWDKNRMREMWKNSYPLYTENIIRSKGNYDVVYGIVSNFHWSIEGSRIICSTEITSKDRIYAGLVSDGTLTVKNEDADKDDVPDSITKSLRDFVENNDILTTAKIVAASRDPLKTINDLVVKNSKLTPWLNILNPLITAGNNDIRNMRIPYVHGVFAGRPKHFYNAFGAPVEGDIDKSGTNQGDPTSGQWINMGLVVAILNSFSALPGGGSKPIFTVDIQNSVIGGHPNLISCDSRILIPNWQAPKFHYGAVGLQNYGGVDPSRPKLVFKAIVDVFDPVTGKSLKSSGFTGNSDYQSQYNKPISLAKNGSLPNTTLAKVCYQRGITGKNCYRNDIDTIINMFRVLYAQPKANQSVGNVSVPSTWSFPARENSYLPESFYGLPGNYVEMDRSGLLSNIYISINTFKDAVLGKLNTKATAKTFDDIYKSILEILNQSVDGFWDLVVVEAENTMTITDKKYVGNVNLDKNPMCVFDYYDADSIIKSIKFKPALSNAQAIRSMFGETNNKESKYFISDPNDLIDYNFKDDVNYNEKARVEGEQNELEKRIALKQQMKDLIGTVQLINVADDSLQITLTRETKRSVFTDHLPLIGDREVLKLCLPNPRILRMLLDDKDEENNQRYCAVQPGITLELTMLGIGGIRTFQYFMVKNLPEPYSQRNIIFRVTDVVQTLESGNWETMIRAQPLPLRKYIKMRVNPPVDGWPPERVIATRPG